MTAAHKMADRVCLVTGANAGIGKATALGMAKMDATVVMVSRNRKKGEVALSAVKNESGNDSVYLLQADLSSLDEIRKLAGDFKSRFSNLHVLINNAGVILPTRSVTVDNFETQFAVNHLAYFLLTNLLIDVLKKSAPSRIINVSSSAHFHAAIDFDDLQSERSYQGNEVYSKTKLANVLFTFELADRLRGTGVTANCLTPGIVATKMLDEYMGVKNAAGATADEGARTSIYLATSSEVENVSGKYFSNKRIVESSKESLDKTIATKLWQVSAELVGLTETI